MARASFEDTAEPTAAQAALSIDLDAIAANWRLLAARAAPAECAAVVKADAYGLGVARVAPALHRAGCRTFFVALLAEAVALRAHLPADSRILVLNGALPGTEAAHVAAGAVPVVNSLGQLAAWRAEAARRGTALPLVLQIDTGMARFGLPPSECAELAGRPELAHGLAPAILMSHLACADAPSHPANETQLARFAEAQERLAAALPGAAASLAASSGIFLGPRFHFDLVRPGAALFGVPPTASAPNPLRAVVRLEARCVQVRRIAAGDTVGYGATWTAPHPTTVATIAVGYADGFLRAGSNRGACCAKDGTILPILGLVSMDSITVDAGPVGEGGLRAGDMVEVIGPGRRLEHVARDAGTIGYEILTSLGGRYERHYLGGGDAA